MLNKHLTSKKDKAHRLLKWLWLAITLVLVVTILFSSWYNFQKDEPYFWNYLWLNGFPVTLLIALIVLLLYLQLKRMLHQRFSVQGALRHAIKNNQFFPHYQPIYSNKRSKFIGVEALLRWQSDDEHLIKPDLFIAEAEESGLIVPITKQLIRQSLEACQAFLQADEQFHIAFNLSRHHFQDLNFFDEMLVLLNHAGVKPAQVLLELTERYLPDYKDPLTREKVNRLKKAGFLIAIDDYGTGHASISYLQQFPFDYLKIDKIYIESIGYGAITEKLTETIIDMADKLNLQTIAEGVETPEQLAYLKQRNIDIIQGWYFAKAMSIEELKEFFEKKGQFVSLNNTDSSET